MDKITKITEGSREIFVADYSDCKEAEMIAILTELKNKIAQGGKPVLILAVFNDKCFATPNFMRQSEQATTDVLHLIEKQAMVGLSDIKKMILKGYNFQFRKNIPVFDTREKAIEFLLDEKTTDASEFWDRV